MKFLIALVFFLSYCLLPAQQIKQGESYSIAKDFSPLRIPGIAGGQLAIVHSSSESRSGYIRDLSVALMDTATLAKKGEWAFNGLFQDRQKFYPEDIRIWNDQLCFFGSAFDKESKSNTLHVITVDNQGIASAPKTLLTSETSHFDFNHKRFYLAGDQFQDRLAVISLNESEDRGIPKVNLALYDRAFREQKKLSAFLPFQGRSPVIADLLLDQPGNVHMLVRGNRGTDSLDVQYSLFVFPVMSDEVIEYQLDIPGKVVSGMHVVLSQNDKLLVSGLLHDDFQKKDQVSGMFFLRIDRETAAVESKGIQRMDAGFKSLFAGESEKTGVEDFSGFTVRDVIPAAKGGVMLIAEKVENEEVCENDYRTGIEVCHMHYRTGKLLVVSFNERGEIDWYQTIDKQQETQDDDGIFLSFIQLIDPANRPVFLYNGVLSRNGKTDDIMTDPEKSQLHTAVVQSNGQVEFLPATLNMPFIPALTWKLTAGRVYTVGQKNGNTSLLRIDAQ